MLVHYLVSSPSESPGPLALVALGLLALSGVAGMWWSHQPTRDVLQDQVRARLGTAVTTWSMAEIVLVLWRFVGMGDPRFIAYLGMAVWAALMAYAAWYLAIRLPRNYILFNQLRERFSTGEVPKIMQGGTRVEDRLSPGWSQAGAGIGTIILYLSMYPSTDHALHWLMILIGALLGYSVGLALTAGHGTSALARKQAQNEPRQMRRGGRATT